MRFKAMYQDFLEREMFLEENMKGLAHTVLQFCTFGTDAVLFHSPVKFDIGSTVSYSKEIRGKRRHYSLSGVVVRRDKKFLHNHDEKGNMIHRTPKYVRRIAIIEE